MLQGNPQDVERIIALKADAMRCVPVTELFKCAEEQQSDNLARTGDTLCLMPRGAGWRRQRLIRPEGWHVPQAKRYRSPPVALNSKSFCTSGRLRHFAACIQHHSTPPPAPWAAGMTQHFHRHPVARKAARVISAHCFVRFA